MLSSMELIAVVLVWLVAVLHLGFLAVEMFLWDTPTGRTLFGTDREFAARSRTLAANQGLYNGFLAAGLIWGQLTDRTDVVVFLLICAVVAGLYGAVTVSRSILLVQALPGALALAAVLPT